MEDRKSIFTLRESDNCVTPSSRKKEYVKPALIHYGEVNKLTAGNGSVCSDGSMPSGNVPVNSAGGCTT